MMWSGRGGHEAQQFNCINNDVFVLNFLLVGAGSYKASSWV
jgi:hypothetical protein